MTSSTEKPTDHWGPQAWEDDPASPWGFDGTAGTGGVLSVEEPGIASPHLFQWASDGGVQEQEYGVVDGLTDVGELWWRYYIDTTLQTGAAVDDAQLHGWISSDALAGGVYLYLLYDASGNLNLVTWYDTTFTHLAYTTTVPDGTALVCVEGHWKNGTTDGALEGWIDGTAFTFNTTSANTSAVGDIGDELLFGMVTGPSTISNTDYTEFDHLAIDTTGRLNTYEERDQKRVGLSNIAGGYAPVPAHSLNGVLVV